MTIEELKKEAEESFEKYRVTDIDYVVSPYSDDEGEKKLMFNNEYDAEEEYFRLYSKGYLASAEPREKRIQEKDKKIAELEEAKANFEYLLEGRDNEIDELKKENKVLAQNLEDTEILNNTYEKRFDNLKKENTELKRENRGIKTCANCDEYVIGRYCNYPNGVCHHWKLSEKYRNDDELTTAKEIIKLLLWDLRNRSYEPVKDVERAEQFLKENSTYERIQKAKYNYTD